MFKELGISVEQFIVESKLERLFRWAAWFPNELELISAQFSQSDYEDMVGYLKDSNEADLVKFVEKIKGN